MPPGEREAAHLKQEEHLKRGALEFILLDNLTADQSCGTLIAPNRWLFPIMIVVSAADREWQLTL